ncbi:hypothetical protein RR46_06340 [Papilio xuthus]|uniref:Uncharacterized protein n=1 Tax=Papilio xuthus TaxID=66420 RepID=A0A194QCI7_PAPXU|nr:hypothetical protein RR46_06340 [Papilio xuthus]
MSRRPKKSVLEKRAREFVVLLRDYFEREQQNGGPLLPLTRVVERVSDALQIGTNTVCRITREKYGKSGMEDNELVTPNKVRERRKRKTNQSTKSSAEAVNIKVPKESNSRVNGVSISKSKNLNNTTVSIIKTNLTKNPSILISSKKKLMQKTLTTKSAPIIQPVSNELPKICNPMVSGFESTTEESKILFAKSNKTNKNLFNVTSIKRKCQNTNLSSKSPLDPVYIEVPNIFSPATITFNTTKSPLKSNHIKDRLIGQTSPKTKCRKMNLPLKSLLDPMYIDMPNVFNPTLSDFGSTTDSTLSDGKSTHKNHYQIHTTSTKSQQPTQDPDSIRLKFKEDLDDNIVLVVHPTIDVCGFNILN